MLLDSFVHQENDPANFASILKLAEDVEALAYQQGLLKTLTGQETKDFFRSLNSERQSQIALDLKTTLRTLQAMNEIERQRPNLSGRARDIESLKSFLSQIGLRLKDEGFYDLISEGDMVEAYDYRAIQIYRNWVCFKYCPYSLIELLVNDWNTLFVRPSWVIDQLMELTPALFSPEGTTIEYEIPEYIFSARLQRPAKAMLFKMKYATPLLHAESGRPVAFITTGKVRHAPESLIGLNLDII